MSSLTVPTPAQPVVASTPAVSTPRAPAYTLRDVMMLGFYHKRVIGALLALSVVIAVIAWIASPVRYDAEAQLLVLFAREQTSQSLLEVPTILSIDGVKATESEVESLRGRAVLRATIEQLGPERVVPSIADRRWFGLLPPLPADERLDAAVDYAQRWLKVSTAQSGSNLVTVAYAHTNRDVAVDLVNTLVDVYLKRRAEVFDNPRAPYLRDKARAYANQLIRAEDELQADKARHSILSLQQETLLALNQVDSTTQRRQHLAERREALVAELKATEQAQAVLPAKIFDFVERNDRADNNEDANTLTKLYLERNTLKERYQDNLPRLQEVEQQIRIMEALVRKPRQITTSNREVRNPAVDILANHALQTRIEAGSVDQSLAEIDRQIEGARKRVDELRAAEQRLNDLERNVQITDQLYREVNQRAEIAQLEEAAAKQRANNVRIVADAVAPMKGTSNGLNIALASIAAGILLAGAFGTIAAWNRQVFVLPQEAERALGMPVLASFGESQSFQSPAAQIQIIYLAGRLMFSRDGEPAVETLQILSGGRGEFRSDFTAALAAEIARGQGKRTLLLDLVGSGEEHWQTLGKLLPGEEPDTSLNVAPTEVPDLYVSVAATAGAVNWQRANGEAFRRLFDTLLSRYQMVVIDAPPAAESLVGLRLANVVDGTILVARAEQTRAPAIANLQRQLLETGGDLFGTIVTGRRFHIPKAILRWI